MTSDLTTDEIIAGLARMHKHPSEMHSDYGVDIVSAAADALSALTRERAWQPIETAPRPGRTEPWTRIICFWPQDGGYTDIAVWKHNHRIYEAIESGQDVGGYAPAYFTPELNEYDDYDQAKPENAPTHWMPLPTPPTAQRASDRSSALVSDTRNVRDNEVRGECPADAAPKASEGPAQDKRGP